MDFGFGFSDQKLVGISQNPNRGHFRPKICRPSKGKLTKFVTMLKTVGPKWYQNCFGQITSPGKWVKTLGPSMGPTGKLISKPLVGIRIFKLSLMDQKLVWANQAFDRHFGFSAFSRLARKAISVALQAKFSRIHLRTSVPKLIPLSNREDSFHFYI